MGWLTCLFSRGSPRSPSNMGGDTISTGKGRGMLDDQYWSGFSSDFTDYELGPAIGISYTG